jgi:hypothetical protein
LKSNIEQFHGYNRGAMNALVQILAKVLVPLFFIGMTGSLFVVIFTVIRDLRQVLSKKDELAGTDL